MTGAKLQRRQEGTGSRAQGKKNKCPFPRDRRTEEDERKSTQETLRKVLPKGLGCPRRQGGEPEEGGLAGASGKIWES